MNKEHCLAFNKMVDCYLNNQINNLFDLEENMKALNNFQAKIDELQEMKDLAQIEHNGIALTILRKYVMREKSGKLLMRNLIRQYYDLNDEQIKRYEKYTRPSGGYYVTNAMVLYRKGSNFVNLGSRYCASNLKSPSVESFVYEDLLRNSFFILASYEWNPDAALYGTDGGKRWPFLFKNNFLDWSNISLLHDLEEVTISLRPLLNNWGYIAWQGIDCIEKTLRHLQVLNNKSRIEKDAGYMSDKEVNNYIEMYSQNIYELISYLPLHDSFVFEYQDKLNWDVLDLNPRIEWTFPLVQILLKKQSLKPEPEQQKGLKGNKGMFNKLFRPLLNDDIISDLEKLYNI